MHFLKKVIVKLLFYFCSFLKKYFQLNVDWFEVEATLFLFVAIGPLKSCHNCKPWVSRLELLTIFSFLCARISGFKQFALVLGIFFPHACVIEFMIFSPPIFCTVSFE